MRSKDPECEWIGNISAGLQQSDTLGNAILGDKEVDVCKKAGGPRWIKATDERSGAFGKDGLDAAGLQQARHGFDLPGLLSAAKLSNLLQGDDRFPRVVRHEMPNSMSGQTLGECRADQLRERKINEPRPLEGLVGQDSGKMVVIGPALHQQVKGAVVERRADFRQGRAHGQPG